ncbi:MAG TPA: signal peptidase I, partial [Actinomycetes bacterium]|nr:signal peptidase I [Actinomycetes bacterium]
DMISRVIAVSGDTVACPARPSGDCDAVEVNGVPLDEGYIQGTTKPFDLTTVGPSEVFLMGDNRKAANDSRFIGAIPVDSVFGVAVQIVDSAGGVRAVPGAPAHEMPDSGVVDPAGPPPPARVATP